MPFTPQQHQQAEAVQHAAAHELSARIRMVAGPGTGKSHTIEERVCWLRTNGIAPERIYVVSFTRAASQELRHHIHSACAGRGIAGADVSVTTLHALCLRILRGAGLLAAYPADPLVMDEWELKHIFDAELAKTTGRTPRRCEDIRRDHEAFWSTGQWGPANYIPPGLPISPAERGEFDQFHGPRTQMYSCVLPGELVRQCVTGIGAGTLDPVAQLHIEHLVVDEFQDLNPIDLRFVDEMIQRGVTTFVAGDDDQSIYSFRFASPVGIQAFAHTHGAAVHSLADCFRCTPAVTQAATALINAFQLPNRIPKVLTSLYSASNPPIPGRVLRWRFTRGHIEARAIAESCRELIAARLSPRDILILVSNTRILLRGLKTAFEAADVPLEPLNENGYLDSADGRVAFAGLRIVCDPDDYVAHRSALGTLPGVGVGTCRDIGDKVIANGLNFRELFYAPLPGAIFSTRETTALNRARGVVALLAGWQPADTLVQRGPGMEHVLDSIFGNAGRQAWQSATFHLPQGITLQELKEYLGADNDEQQAELLTQVYARLGQAPPAAGVLPQRIRIMTMHGAKGLSARVVFVPGLEEQILPGPRRQPYPGLVLEGARLLYVSISRARAACIVSYANSRVVYGSITVHIASRYANHLSGAFQQRAAGLGQADAAAIQADCTSL